MVLAIYIIKVKKESFDGIIEILNFVTSRTQYKNGCQESSVWKCDDPSEIMLFEVWNTRACLEKHIGSAIYKNLLVVLDLAAEKPLIQIFDYENICGIELIEEVIVNLRKTSSERCQKL